MRNKQRVLVRVLGFTCVLVLLFLGLSLAGCVPLTIGPTPTPTRTPKPTLTPTPSPTLTPSPTPTPAFPVTVGCALGTPLGACRALQMASVPDPAHFAWVDTGDADVHLSLTGAEDARQLGTWTYAVVVPFFTVEDEVTSADVLALWQGAAPSPQSEFLTIRPLVVSTGTFTTLQQVWGAPTDTVKIVAASDLLSETEALGGWSVVPFQNLEPQWKVLRVDGISLLERGLAAGVYPFVVPVYLHSTRLDALDLLSLDPAAFTSRDEMRMTIVAMTGVTAMARGTGRLMDTKGITYPAVDIKPWFSDADFVHISNEVSFTPDCVAGPSGTMSFCSNDSYIALLEEIGTDIVELTGNHLVDKGIDPLRHTFELFKERGWRWYGGGENFTDASRPLTLTHGANKIAWFGCNTIDNPYDWATDDLPGVATCRLRDRQALDPAKLDQMRAQIAELKAEGYQIIITLQYYETYEYVPYLQQIRDFHTFAELGADYVQGSQAHQAQTMEFHGDTFIHYGLGNFFFDQMQSDGTRQEFVNRLTFYDGRLLSIDLRTAILEEYGRPRPMTVGDANPAGDRAKFLQMIFDLRP